MHRSTRIRIAVALAVLATLALAALAGPALAFETRSGGNATILPGETINDTVFMSGRSVMVGGTVNGDVFVAGTAVAVTGTVRGNVIAAGSDVTIDGTVTGDVAAAGSTVRIGPKAHVGGEAFAAGSQTVLEGAFARNVFAAGSNVDLAGGATVARDAALAGSDLTVAGKVERDLFGAGSTATITGAVARNVDARVQTLTVRPGATIGGDLTYVSPAEGSIAAEAVSGRVTHTTPPPTRTTAADPIWLFVGWLQGLIGVALFGLLLTLIAAPMMDRAAARARADLWPSLGFGALAAFATPPVALVVFVVGLFLGAWWIAVFALIALAIALVVGYVISALCLGLWLLEKMGRPGAHRILAMLLGVLVLGIGAAIPFLGLLVTQVASVIGLGALLMAAWARPKPPAATVATPASPAEPMVVPATAMMPAAVPPAAPQAPPTPPAEP